MDDESRFDCFGLEPTSSASNTRGANRLPTSCAIYNWCGINPTRAPTKPRNGLTFAYWIAFASLQYVSHTILYNQFDLPINALKALIIGWCAPIRVSFSALRLFSSPSVQCTNNIDNELPRHCDHLKDSTIHLMPSWSCNFIIDIKNNTR